MKKEIITHFSFLVFFLVLVILVKGWVSFSSWPLFVGGLVGTIIPDIDHLIYVYFLRPSDFTSQRVNYYLKKRQLLSTLSLLADTREERKSLIFHTAYFQVIFLFLTFLVLTSTNSLFGRGLVLAFFLHLIVDQLIDLLETGSIKNWLGVLKIEVDEKLAKVYLLTVSSIFVLLAVFF